MKDNIHMTKTWNNPPQGHSFHSSAPFRLSQNNLLVTCPGGDMLATSCTCLPKSKSEIIQGSLLKKEESVASYLLWKGACPGLVTRERLNH